mgnify:CR=1 FL=1
MDWEGTMIRPVQATTEPASGTFRIFDLAALSKGGEADVLSAVLSERDSMRAVIEFAVALDPVSVPLIAVVEPGIILDHQFSKEVASAVADSGIDGITWLALVSDGIDISGERLDSGNYLEDPATPSARPLRLVARAEPAVAVVAVAALQSVIAAGDAPATFSDLVDAGADHGLPVLVSHRLRFSSLRGRLPPPTDGTGAATDIVPASIRPDPTISVVVRTATSRPAMLERNLRALVDEHADSRLLEVIIASAAGAERLTDVVADASRRHPSLPLVALPVEADGAASRSAAMLGGLVGARGDYVWYVDDDDWVASGSVGRIKASVHATDRPILVGAVQAFDESWDGDDLLDATLARRYLPREWYRAFTGWNFLPNCSLVIPREIAIGRVSAAPPQSDLGEDYALQLLLFTAPGSIVHVIDEPIANISWRQDGDSVVAMEDRTPWLRDLSSHISDLSNDPTMSAAGWWRLGAAVRELPYPDTHESEPDPPMDGEANVYTPHPAARFVPRAARPAIARLRRRIQRPPS